jgi:SAF domain
MALGSVRPETGRDERPVVQPPAGRGPWRAARRRGRRLPYLSVGALLVLVCVLGFAAATVRLGQRVSVLAVSRPVAAGQRIEAADLTQVSAADDPSLGLIPVSQASAVVGRTAVVPLPPGILLTRNLIGDAAFPPAGKVVASLAVKPGQYPQGLTAGAHVAVFVPAGNTPAGGQTSTGTSTAPTRLSAVVLGVDPRGDGQGSTVVTLLLDASDASRLAGAGGVVLMQTAPGGD